MAHTKPLRRLLTDCMRFAIRLAEATEEFLEFVVLHARAGVFNGPIDVLIFAGLAQRNVEVVGWRDAGAVLRRSPPDI